MDRRLFVVFLTILPLLTNPVLSDCENSEDEELDSSSSSGATLNQTHELAEVMGGNTLEEDEAEEEEEEETRARTPRRRSTTSRTRQCSALTTFHKLETSVCQTQLS